MATTDPKREQIVRELLDRLAAGFPDAIVERGFFEDAVTQYPSIYVSEDTETKELVRTGRVGMYQCELPIVVSYFTKGESKTTLYRKANLMLSDVASIVEADDRFSGLCVHYRMADVNVLLYTSMAIQVAVTYIFTYTHPAPWAQ